MYFNNKIYDDLLIHVRKIIGEKLFSYYLNGYSKDGNYKKLAKDLNISESKISRIFNGKTVGKRSEYINNYDSSKLHKILKIKNSINIFYFTDEEIFDIVEFFLAGVFETHNLGTNSLFVKLFVTKINNYFEDLNIVLSDKSKISQYCYANREVILESFCYYLKDKTYHEGSDSFEMDLLSWIIFELSTIN